MPFALFLFFLSLLTCTPARETPRAPREIRKLEPGEPQSQPYFSRDGRRMLGLFDGKLLLVDTAAAEIIAQYPQTPVSISDVLANADLTRILLAERTPGGTRWTLLDEQLQLIAQETYNPDIVVFLEALPPRGNWFSVLTLERVGFQEKMREILESLRKRQEAGEEVSQETIQKEMEKLPRTLRVQRLVYSLDGTLLSQDTLFSGEFRGDSSDLPPMWKPNPSGTRAVTSAEEAATLRVLGTPSGKPLAEARFPGRVTYTDWVGDQTLLVQTEEEAGPGVHLWQPPGQPKRVPVEQLQFVVTEPEAAVFGMVTGSEAPQLLIHDATGEPLAALPLQSKKVSLHRLEQVLALRLFPEARLVFFCGMFQVPEITNGPPPAEQPESRYVRCRGLTWEEEIAYQVPDIDPGGSTTRFYIPSPTGYLLAEFNGPLRDPQTGRPLAQVPWVLKFLDFSDGSRATNPFGG